MCSRRMPLMSCSSALKRRKRVLETFLGKESKLTCGDMILDGKSSADYVTFGEDSPDEEIRLDSD